MTMAQTNAVRASCHLFLRGSKVSGIKTLKSYSTGNCDADISLRTKDGSSSTSRLNSGLSTNHHDLSSFLEYADRVGLKETSTIYKGTRYEYLVAERLACLGFSLSRIGRTNDMGIDLIGSWAIPNEERHRNTVKVLVQCKASKPTPAMIRELQGAYEGAPAGWRNRNVLAMLVATEPGTDGMNAAMQRSRWPLAMLQITKNGFVKQFVWNDVARRNGLEGLGVTSCYTADSSPDKPVEMIVALTWNGRMYCGSAGKAS